MWSGRKRCMPYFAYYLADEINHAENYRPDPCFWASCLGPSLDNNDAFRATQRMPCAWVLNIRNSGMRAFGDPKQDVDAVWAGAAANGGNRFYGNS